MINRKRKELIEEVIHSNEMEDVPVSNYFRKEAEHFVKEEITLDELENRITLYHENKGGTDDAK